MLQKTVFVSNTCSMSILEKIPEKEHICQEGLELQSLWSFPFHWTSIHLSHRRWPRRAMEGEKSYLHTSLCQCSWRPHGTDPVQVLCVTNGKFGGPTEKTQAKEQQTIENLYFFFYEETKNWLTAFKKPHCLCLANMIKAEVDTGSTIPFHVFKIRKLLLKMPFPDMRSDCSTFKAALVNTWEESWGAMECYQRRKSLLLSLCIKYFLQTAPEAESRFKLAA